MRDEKEERTKQARSNKQTNKAKQHSTPKAVTLHVQDSECMFNPFNSNFNFMPCCLHPASNGNAISESDPEYEGHAHHYVIT